MNPALPQPQPAHPQAVAAAAARARAAEAELVAGARAGSRDDFERLAVAAMPALLGSARRLLGDGFEADEAIAEALFRAWRHLGRFRGDARFATWLQRILYRVTVDRYRRRNRDRKRRAALQERMRSGGRLPGHGTAHAAEGCPRRSSQVRERRAQLRTLIEALPDRQRLILLLHAWEGLSLREIAGVVGIRYATVKSHLNHARTALRRRLEEGGRS